MRKKTTLSVIATLLLAGGVLAGCGNNAEEQTAKQDPPKQADQAKDQTSGAKEDEAKEVDQTVAASYKAAVDELKKDKVDYAKVTKIYTEQLQGLVQKADEATDQQITAALGAGQAGELSSPVVKQVFDKLMQKAFYATIKGEFNEINDKWGDKEVAKEEIAEAKEFYAILEGTVAKRDEAYSLNLVDVINGGFAAIETAVADGDQLGFQLAKQTVDKTLMKTFYLAVGALPNGYASKVAKEAKEDVEKAKAEQAEGWAFYQSLTGYFAKKVKEEHSIINDQLDLATDVKAVDPEVVNKAFVSGFAKIALGELGESGENLGKDKGVITALEGALFIDVIASDIERILGAESAKQLQTQAQSFLDAAKAGDQAAALPLLDSMKTTLNKVVDAVK